VPQFDLSFFVPEVIWTLVSFGLLFLLLKRFVLPRVTHMLEERTRHIESELMAAASQRQQAEALHQEYEQKLQAIDDEAKRMFDDADRRIREHRDLLMSEWREEVRRRQQQLHDDAEVARSQAMRDIRRQTAEMVVEATEKAIHQHLDTDEAEHMVDEAVAAIEQSLHKDRRN